MAAFRAIDVLRPGGPEVLVPFEHPPLVPARDELLVAVHAAGVNRIDLKQRAGEVEAPPGAPRIPGLEVCGVVTACGPATLRFRVGDFVCALVAGGGYAEMCVAPEAQCLPLPCGLSPAEGAALPEAVLTVWLALFEQAWLTRGDTLLVHGGGGGIGTTAIQMGRAAGARVFATAGSKRKTACAERLGAERAIDYDEPPFAPTLRAHLGKGVDVILDSLGAPYLASNLELLNDRGRLCCIAGDGGRDLQFDVRALMRKRAYVTGITLRDRPPTEKARLAVVVERVVWPWIESGLVRPQIGLTLPLEEAASAHRALAERRVVGKAILTTRAGRTR